MALVQYLLVVIPGSPTFAIGAYVQRKRHTLTPQTRTRLSPQMPLTCPDAVKPCSFDKLTPAQVHRIATPRTCCPVVDPVQSHCLRDKQWRPDDRSREQTLETLATPPDTLL